MADQRPQSQKDRAQPPTGTAGRRSGTDTHDLNDARRGDTPPPARKRANLDEDEDSPLGTRNTFR